MEPVSKEAASVMAALRRTQDNPFARPGWQADVAAMLDESHLIATSDHAGTRSQFAGSIGSFLQGLRDAEVCTLYGRFITDLDSFCYQLERALPGHPLDRRIDGPRGITNLLRTREIYRGRPAAKFRFYVWHDADVLLHADRDLFGRIVDSISGVASEAEYVSDDVLLIHRLVAVGGSALSLYSEDPEGQFQSWYCDGMGEPFWSVVTGIPAPTFTPLSIDSLLAEAR
jgi:hypothetical protein